MQEDQIISFIKEQITNNDVVLFMKGTASQPQCGFSSLVVKILQAFELEFADIDVLENQDLRQGIKDYTSWPTVPQLYIKGEFVGGSDIVKEMYESGEFKQILIDSQLISA